LLSGTPTTPGTYTFTVLVTDTANVTATSTLSITINAPARTVTLSSIGNAASYTNGGVAPGEMVVLFGSGMGPSSLASLQTDSRGYASTNLAGTQVLFDGVAAPLIYTRTDQVSTIVPYEVTGNNSTNVQVVYQGLGSNTVSVPVDAALFGILTADSSGKGQGAIVNQDGTINSASNPAPAGSVMLVFAKGGGPDQSQRRGWEAQFLSGAHARDAAGYRDDWSTRCAGPLCRRSAGAGCGRIPG